MTFKMIREKLSIAIYASKLQNTNRIDIRSDQKMPG